MNIKGSCSGLLMCYAGARVIVAMEAGLGQTSSHVTVACLALHPLALAQFIIATTLTLTDIRVRWDHGLDDAYGSDGTMG